ncbi:MAG: dicarboxylate/amino acid:cation symporter [Oscillospiraceae bacterium]|nr:dicarboxylate/amino acid:cation symporter [Oscillospiraceae bacterium]
MATVKKFSNLSLTTQIVIGTVLGLIIGTIVGPAIADIRIVGDIFLRLIQMAVPLLIMGAVIEAIGKIELRSLGKIGIKLAVWFTATSALAGTLALSISLLINPGRGIPYGALAVAEVPAAMVDMPQQTMTQVILGFFGTNIVGSLAAGTLIHIIVFSLFFGTALSMYTSATGNTMLIDGISSFNKVLLGMLKNIMKLAPVGIFTLMCWVAGHLGLAIVLPLLRYLLTLCLILAAYYAISFTGVSLYVGVSPIKTFRKLSGSIIMATTTTSSAVTLPTLIDEVVNKLGASRKISNTVNPLGITLNADGQAMFTAAGLVMMSQLFGMDLSIGTLVQMVVLGTLATFGIIAVPGGALVALAALMPQFGIPIEGIAIIAGVDWFRGMITTPANITGDGLVAMAIAKDENEFYKEVYDGVLTAEEAAEKYAATGGKVVTT